MDATTVKHSNVKITGKRSDTETVMLRSHSEIITKVNVPLRHTETTKTDNSSNLIVANFDKLNWFNTVDISQLDTLANMHRESSFTLSGIPPSLVPVVDVSRISSDKELNLTYSSLLYKQVDIPILESANFNLSQQLLSTLYLNCVQALLSNRE